MIERYVRVGMWRLKGFFLKYYLVLHGCKVGKNLKCKQWPTFRAIPKNNISIGNNVNIGYRITLEVIPSGKLTLSDYVSLTQDVLISAANNVFLGEYAACAEFVSIRDSDHGIKKGTVWHNQEIITDPIRIEKGCGIGRGTAIFRGVTIKEDAIIGANCILMRNFSSVPNGIYFGNPPKLIGKRF
jgi:acetyltransferase-like isoleucine patch superfamily enzyme